MPFIRTGGNIIQGNTIYGEFKASKKRYTLGLPYEYPVRGIVSPIYAATSPDAETQEVRTRQPIKMRMAV